MTELGKGAWNAPYLLLSLVAVFWAGNATIGRAIRDVVPPFTLACSRWMLASLIVTVFARRQLLRDAADLRQHWRSILLLGVIGVGLYNTLLYLSVHYTTASNALLVSACQPPLIMLLGVVFFRDPTGPVRIGGIALSLAGVLAILAHGDASALLHLRFNRGDALVVAASVFWSLYSVLLRRRPPLHPLSFLAGTFWVGVLVNLPLALAELASGARLGNPRIAALGIAYVGIFPSLLAYLLFNRGVALIGAAAAGQFLNLVPVFGALLAAALLGEPLHLYHAAGMVLIVAGIILFSRAGNKLLA